MTISYTPQVWSLPSGGSITLNLILGSSDFDAGGEYHGPMAVSAVALSNPNKLLTPSTVGLITKAQIDEFTTNVVYRFSIRNDSDDSVSFRVHAFHN